MFKVINTKAIKNNITYLPGLNALRSFAAIVVLIYHYEFLFTKHYGIDKIRLFPTNHQAATAVTLFFVLSGFLITFLMLLEKENTHTINIKFFYIRRIMRIWPLYFLIIVFTILLNYAAGYDLLKEERGLLMLYSTFLGNVIEPLGIVASNSLNIIAPLLVLWSVGVEEQFYLIWPLLNKAFNNKNIFIAILIFILLYQAVKLIFRYLHNTETIAFLSLTRIDCMAIGAISAWVFKNRTTAAKSAFNFLVSKPVQLLSISLFTIIFCFKVHIASLFDQQLFSIVFSVVIINTANYSFFFKALENTTFNFLGQISYGIYMYHVLIIMAISNLFFKIDKIQNSYTVYFGFLILIISLTVLVSYFSHRFIEKPFLKIKSRFMLVKSANRMIN